MSLIEWTGDGYPTPGSLDRLKTALEDEDMANAIRAFYEALRANHDPDWCGPERVEVRGEVIEVWGYHTGGWSGNEDIIAVLQESWLWSWLLERYDRGGHYYVQPPEKVLGEARAERPRETDAAREVQG